MRGWVEGGGWRVGVEHGWKLEGSLATLKV